jgi:hypothetical protein
MDRALQQLVWSKLPLNDIQRNDMLNDLAALPVEAQDDIESTSHVQKKRKRHSIEQSENQDHSC